MCASMSRTKARGTALDLRTSAERNEILSVEIVPLDPSGPSGRELSNRRVDKMTARSILCPVDFSAASLASIPLAVQEARLRDATLDLLHVWQPGLEYSGEGPPIPFAAEFPKEEIESDLASLDVDLPDDRVRLHVTSGDPVKDIVELASKLNSELVVMGTHARRGLRRWIIGSVCEPLLRQLPLSRVGLPGSRTWGQVIVNQWSTRWHL